MISFSVANRYLVLGGSTRASDLEVEVQVVIGVGVGNSWVLLMLGGYIDTLGMLSGGMMERNAYLRVGIMASCL